MHHKYALWGATPKNRKALPAPLMLSIGLMSSNSPVSAPASGVRHGRSHHPPAGTTAGYVGFSWPCFIAESCRLAVAQRHRPAPTKFGCMSRVVTIVPGTRCRKTRDDESRIRQSPVGETLGRVNVGVYRGGLLPRQFFVEISSSVSAGKLARSKGRRGCGPALFFNWADVASGPWKQRFPEPLNSIGRRTVCNLQRRTFVISNGEAMLARAKKKRLIAVVCCGVSETSWPGGADLAIKVCWSAPVILPSQRNKGKRPGVDSGR